MSEIKYSSKILLNEISLLSKKSFLAFKSTNFIILVSFLNAELQILLSLFILSILAGYNISYSLISFFK